MKYRDIFSNCIMLGDMREGVMSTRPSEFMYNGYDQESAIKALREALCELRPEVESISDLSFSFNTKYFDSYKPENESRPNWESIMSNFKVLSGIGYIDSSESDKPIDVNEYIPALENNLWDVYCLYDDRELYHKKEADRYLDAFYEFTRKCVFSPSNYNLSSPAFRHSKFLKAIISLVAEEKSWEYGTYYSYNLLDPFAHDNVQRAIHCAYALRKSLCGTGKSYALLANLRMDLYLDSMHSAFNRFISIENKTYKIESNRHASSLLAVPYEDLSSIEAVKPIRLFEKIAAYIRNNIADVDDAIYEVNICIIGHTEPNANGEEIELLDLCKAILSWYHALPLDQEGASKPLLHLYIHNIVNRYNGPGSYNGHRRKNFGIECDSDEIKCYIEETSYSTDFEFNTIKLKEIISQNQVIFILDCPFLTTENFEIKKSGSLAAFCSELQDRTRSQPDVNSCSENAFYRYLKDSTMKYLDAQFDRVMSSGTQNAGEVIRVVKDELLMKIEHLIADHAGDLREKCLYVFTSERDGIDYSYIASYPLTRCERYDGKAFTIICYSNRRHSGLKCNVNGKASFRIRLWSILKYLSVSYAYLEFEQELKKCLKTEPEDGIVCFQIYHNVIIIGNVDPTLTNIKFEIRVTDGLRKSTDAIGYHLSDDEIKNILELVKRFVVTLYRDNVFTENRKYGTEAIQTAFSMNLYSAVRDVNTMLLWHKYRIACERGSLDEFNVIFEKDINDTPLVCAANEFFSTDFFSDRKVYDIMLETLQYSDALSIGLKAMLYDDRDIFGGELYAGTVLNNLAVACEQGKQTGSMLYRNIKCIYNHDI